MGNVLDGLDIQVRYTNLRHGRDMLTDMRSAVEQQKLASKLDDVQHLTRWRTNFLTFQFSYDAEEAQKNWKLRPYITGRYEFPFEWFKGRNAVKHSQLSLDISLHF